MIDPSQIHEHAEVVGSDGEHVGTIDHMEGRTRVRLTHYSSRSGQFHQIPIEWIEAVRDGKVWLNKTRAEAVAFWHPHPIDPNNEDDAVDGNC
jgi:hypothetical protein